MLSLLVGALERLEEHRDGELPTNGILELVLIPTESIRILPKKNEKPVTDRKSGVWHIGKVGCGIWAPWECETCLLFDELHALPVECFDGLVDVLARIVAVREAESLAPVAKVRRDDDEILGVSEKRREDLSVARLRCL